MTTPSLVTVFGGSGFVGRYVVKHLVATGARVRVAVRHPNEAFFIKPMGDVAQIVLTEADVRNRASVDAAVAGADAVVNLAGILFESGRQRFDAIHAQGAERVAQAAAAAGVTRLVHVSALGADPAAPSLYGRSKAHGEVAVRAAFTDAVILRPALIFGAEDRFFNRFAALAQLSPVLPLIGGGTRFQPVYVGDVAAAVTAALFDPSQHGRMFELGGPRVYTMRALLEKLLAEIGRKRWLVPLPRALALAEAAVWELLPTPILTRDQVRMLDRDCVVAPEARTLADLGIEPTPLDAILPTYLGRFRRPISQRA